MSLTVCTSAITHKNTLEPNFCLNCWKQRCLILIEKERDVLWLLFTFLLNADIKHFLITIKGQFLTLVLASIMYKLLRLPFLQKKTGTHGENYKFQKLPLNDDFLIRVWLYLQRPSRETCTHTDKALLWKNEWSLSTVRFFTVLYCLNPCFVLGLHYWLISLNLAICYPKLLISPLIQFRTLSLSRLFMNWFRVLIINRSLNWI